MRKSAAPVMRLKWTLRFAVEKHSIARPAETTSSPSKPSSPECLPGTAITIFYGHAHSGRLASKDCRDSFADHSGSLLGSKRPGSNQPLPRCRYAATRWRWLRIWWRRVLKRHAPALTPICVFAKESRPLNPVCAKSSHLEFCFSVEPTWSVEMAASAQVRSAQLREPITLRCPLQHSQLIISHTSQLERDRHV